MYVCMCVCMYVRVCVYALWYFAKASDDFAIGMSADTAGTLSSALATVSGPISAMSKNAASMWEKVAPSSHY